MLARYQIIVEKGKEQDIDKSFILLSELSAFQNFKHCLHIITFVERGDVGDPGATVSSPLQPAIHGFKLCKQPLRFAELGCVHLTLPRPHNGGSLVD